MRIAFPIALALVLGSALSCGGKSETDGRGGSASGNGGTGAVGTGGSGGLTGGTGATGTGATGATGGVGNPCALVPDPGPCKGLVRRWFFDSVIDKCTPFVYGGCQGNANNFESAIECVNQCAPGVTNACDAMACPSKTICAFTGGNPVCATPCGDDQSCSTGTCGCGSSCPDCENCIPICVGG